jgi:hypothetical protein
MYLSHLIEHFLLAYPGFALPIVNDGKVIAVDSKLIVLEALEGAECDDVFNRPDCALHFCIEGVVTVGQGVAYSSELLNDEVLVGCVYDNPGTTGRIAVFGSHTTSIEHG